MLLLLADSCIMATRCKKCSTAYFPPQLDCPKCLVSDVEWFEIKSLGKLLTYTVAHYGPTGFETETPYTVGVVEFKEGVRILARICKNIDVKGIKVGMDLKVAPIILPNDRIAYEFRK